MPLASPVCSVLTISDCTVATASPVSASVPGFSGARTLAASMSCPMARLIVVRLFPHGSEHFNELNRRGAYSDDPDCREDAHNEREDHLHARLGRRFFGALPPLGPQRFRKDAQRVRDA